MDKQVTGGKLRQCYKCGFFETTPETRCPRCGRTLKTSTAIRFLGVMMLLLGGFLAVVMAYLWVWVTQAAATVDGYGASRFTGSHEQLLMIYGLFGFILVFGIFGVVGGLWQIVFGKRSKVFVRTILGMAVVLYVGAIAIYFALK